MGEMQGPQFARRPDWEREGRCRGEGRERAGSGGLACPAKACGPQLVGGQWEPASNGVQGVTRSGVHFLKAPPSAEIAFKGCEWGRESVYSL